MIDIKYVEYSKTLCRDKSLRISGIYQISFNKNMTQIIFNLLYEGSLCSQNSNKRKDIFETDLKVEFDKFTHSLVSNLWLCKMVIDFFANLLKCKGKR